MVPCRFRNLPDVYPRKHTFSTIEEWEISASFAYILDIAYLFPEYHELRGFSGGNAVLEQRQQIISSYVNVIHPRLSLYSTLASS
jgi:hypothetical protein